jgi:hypothetical protein
MMHEVARTLRHPYYVPVAPGSMGSEVWRKMSVQHVDFRDKQKMGEIHDKQVVIALGLWREMEI